jgi:hypothetical protein
VTAHEAADGAQVRRDHRLPSFHSKIDVQAVHADGGRPLSIVPPRGDGSIDADRSDPGDIPSDLMVEYYTQRASDGGLIIAVFASARGAGLANTSRPDGSCILRHWAGVTPI